MVKALHRTSINAYLLSRSFIPRPSYHGPSHLLHTLQFPFVLALQKTVAVSFRWCWKRETQWKGLWATSRPLFKHLCVSEGQLILLLLSYLFYLLLFLLIYIYIYIYYYCYLINSTGLNQQRQWNDVENSKHALLMKMYFYHFSTIFLWIMPKNLKTKAPPIVIPFLLDAMPINHGRKMLLVLIDASVQVSMVQNTQTCELGS